MPMPMPMPTHEANNLAALIVQQLGGRVEALKLQKLMYYCNGWSLALRNKALFSDETQAWKHGPVIPSIYAQHRLMPSVESWSLGDPTALERDDRTFAEEVIDLYGAKSGWTLRQMTHAEDPWKNAWARCGYGANRGEVISKEEIRDYFESLS